MIGFVPANIFGKIIFRFDLFHSMTIFQPCTSFSFLKFLFMYSLTSYTLVKMFFKSAVVLTGIGMYRSNRAIIELSGGELTVRVCGRSNSAGFMILLESILDSVFASKLRLNIQRYGLALAYAIRHAGTLDCKK